MLLDVCRVCFLPKLRGRVCNRGEGGMVKFTCPEEGTPGG